MRQEITLYIVLTSTHHQNRVRGHWRTGSSNAGVEENLRKQSDITDTQGNKTEIRNQRAYVPDTCTIYIMSCSEAVFCL